LRYNAGMDESFDPYYVWLGIPPHEQPPHHYRLLGVALFEPRSDVIQLAAQKQIAHVKSFVVGDYAEISRRLLTELTQAKLCLLNPSKRAKYDAQLRAQLGGAVPAVVPQAPSTVPGLAVPQSGPAAAPGQGATANESATASRLAAPAFPAHGSQQGADATPHAEGTPHAGVLQTPPCPPQRIWTVGADPDCDVVVPAPPVSARHCRLIQADDGLYVEDLSSTNGTWVDGRRIEGRMRITTSSRVTLGRRTPLPWPQELLGAEAPAAARFVTIGAAPDNDIVIDMPMVSGHHARLVVESHGVYIEDLGSTNGTGLGSPANRIRRAKLDPADIVYLGSYPVPAARLLEIVNRR